MMEVKFWMRLPISALSGRLNNWQAPRFDDLRCGKGRGNVDEPKAPHGPRSQNDETEHGQVTERVKRYPKSS